MDVYKAQIGSNTGGYVDVMTSTCYVCRNSHLSVFTGSVIIVPNSFRKLLIIEKSINHLCTLCDSNTIELDKIVHKYYCCVHKLNSQDHLASTKNGFRSIFQHIISLYYNTLWLYIRKLVFYCQIKNEN